MAEFADRIPTNAAGRFYVDTSCIDCDLCRQFAPDMFARDDDAGMSIVTRQPQSAEEEALAEEAVDECPTESIGCDGASLLTSQ